MMELRLEGLSVGRGERTLINSFDLSLRAGGVMLLKGRNGAGKTTLLRTIAGFLRPLQGRIALAGGDEEASVGEQCHYVGHLNAVKASLTPRETLEFWARFLSGGDWGGQRANPPDAAMERLGLVALADIPTGYLSAGQKRRLALARLLIAPRPLWLLDEPTVSLDADATVTLAALIGEHCAAGGLVVAATHIDLGLAHAQELQLKGARGEPTEAAWALC